MKIVILQHVPFEGPAAIRTWARSNGHELRCFVASHGAELPSIDSFDSLIIMGGPMSVNDQFTWMAKEMDLIRSAITAQRYVIGICLGAQLIAASLGAEITPHDQREIGWFNVEYGLSPEQEIAHPHWSNGLFPPQFMPLHWHGDRFDIPPNATAIIRSEACENQGFIVGEYTIALQFHLEFDQSAAVRVIHACKNELLEGGSYVQTEQEILSNEQAFHNANALLFLLLEAMATHFLTAD
tara:strand:+ start:2942 stop:3661 length:720 start_codon:yes stop_codon:yes gene_type:complete